MKVLHLPYNIGSKISITVSALRKIGVDAKGIAVNNSLDEAGENILVFNPHDYSIFNPKKLFVYLQASREIKKWIQWADIVHWYFDCRLMRTERFVDYVKYLNKPAVVEWLGSEIRIPEILAAHNSYYKKTFDADYGYKHESHEHSLYVQNKFKNAGFETLVRPELEEFIQKDIYPSFRKINNRTYVKNFIPSFPNPENKKPLIVHPSTSRGTKGTSHVLNAIKLLKLKYQFDFLTIENEIHHEAMNKLSKADIVIDQLILGAFGTTSLEGMALGKPVVCGLTAALQQKLPGIPIVNANPDTLYSVLETLLTNPALRNQIGISSRKYAEENHDADKIAVQLSNIYEEVIRNKK